MPIPGVGNATHKYWVFPIVSGDPKALIAELRANGFDGADLPRSQAVAAPADRPELDPATARDTLKHLVVLPCYPGMPEHELRREAAIVRRAAARTAPQPLAAVAD